MRADKSSHTLLLSGVYVGGHAVLVRARLAVDSGVTMQLAVRAEMAALAHLIVSAVG